MFKQDSYLGTQLVVKPVGAVLEHVGRLFGAELPGQFGEQALELTCWHIDKC